MKETLKTLFKDYKGDYRKDFDIFEYFGESAGNERL